MMGERGPLGNSLLVLPGYAEAFGFISVEAEAMRMRCIAGSRLAKGKVSNGRVTRGEPLTFTPVGISIPQVLRK